MPGPDVKCVAHTCTHWMTGDLCGARNIDIMHEEEEHMAQTVEETMCKTFSHANTIFQMIGSMDNVNWKGAIFETVAPGYRIKPSVTCTVSSCEYWGEGSLCVARAIEISGMNANECQDTNCVTFKRR
jgi:hypothetical protein